MNAGTVFASDILRKGVTFKRLTLKDYGTIEESLREAREERVSLQMDALGLNKEQKFAYLRDADAFPVGWPDVQRYMGTRKGAEEALRLSLKKSGLDDKAVEDAIENFDVIEASGLALELFGFTRQLDESYTQLMEVWNTLTEQTKADLVKTARESQKKPPNPQ